MTATRSCLKCGAELPPEVVVADPDGACPACGAIYRKVIEAGAPKPRVQMPTAKAAMPLRHSSKAVGWSVAVGGAILFFAILHFANNQPTQRVVTNQERKAEIARMEPWQMLAKLDGASRDELKSTRFRWLVEHLSAAYGEPPNAIADMTFATQASLKKTGIGESLLDILEAMNGTSNFRSPQDKYAEHLAVYSVLRSSGQNSAEAVAGMNGMNLHEVVRRLTGR